MRFLSFIILAFTFFVGACSSSSDQKSNESANSKASDTPTAASVTPTTILTPAMSATPTAAVTPLEMKTPPKWTMAPQNAPETTTSAPSAPNADLTVAKYDKLKAGMNYSEVVKILGREGGELMKSDENNVRKVTYKWEGEKNVYVVLSFENDKLTYISQANLKKIK